MTYAAAVTANMLGRLDSGSPFALPTRYQALQEDDGTIRVSGVPIFGENRRTMPSGEEAVYDAAWLRRAAENDKQLRTTGYRVPLHFGHHEPGVVREPAGHVELEEVKLREYNGHPIWILFGTLVFRDANRFAKAKGDFPYRSVEISHEKPDEINSLALLDTDAPFFRFPNLTFRATHYGAAHLWRHQFSMSDVAFAPEQLRGLPPPPKDERGGLHQGKPPAPAPAKLHTTDSAPADDKSGVSKHSADADADADAYDADADADGMAPANDYDADAAPAAGGQPQDPMSALSQRIAKLEALVAKIAGSADPGVQPSGGPAPAAHPAQKPHSPVVSASALARLEGQFAAQSARIQGLEKQLKDRDEHTQAFSTLRQALKPYGIPNLDSELRHRIKDGTAHAWAAGIQANPLSRRAKETPSESQDSPEVAKYAELGPEIHARARREAEIYRSASKGSVIRKYPLANYLAAQIQVQE